MMLSAAMSLDDVVISFFVTSAETTTLPLKVYTGLRSGGTPEINALSTLMLGVIFICVALSQFLTAKSNAEIKISWFRPPRSEERGAGNMFPAGVRGGAPNTESDALRV